MIIHFHPEPGPGRTGANASQTAAPIAGEEVALHLIDHGEIATHARWAGDGRVGLHFARPLE